MSIITVSMVVCNVCATLGKIYIFIYHVEAKPQVYVNTAAWWNIKPSPKDKRHISVNKHSTAKALHFMNIKSDTLNPTSLVFGGPIVWILTIHCDLFAGACVSLMC